MKHPRTKRPRGYPVSQRTKPPLDLDLLIFDMDGVLVDVARSYRATIQETVNIYLETCLGFKGGKKRFVTQEDISLLKSAGGFNNDWDLTSGLLHYLLSLSGLPALPRRKRVSSIQEGMALLQKMSSRSAPRGRRWLQRKRLGSFLKRLGPLGRGPTAVRRALGNRWGGWIYGTGDLDRENLVQRIFQEVYLGDRFTSHHRLSPVFYRGKGHHLRERLLIPKQLLATLRRRLRLGIASGRPRSEAELALKRFGLLPYFRAVVTLDESRAEEDRVLHKTGRTVSRTKPHPYPILRAIRQSDLSHPRCGYVGDVPDDMLAARAARKDVDLLAIGFVGGRRQGGELEKALLRAGADVIVKDPQDLVRRITAPSRRGPHRTRPSKGWPRSALSKKPVDKTRSTPYNLSRQVVSRKFRAP